MRGCLSGQVKNQWNLIRELIGTIDQLIPKGHLAQAKEESAINGLHEESSMSGSGYQSSETMQ